jgi:hypothetical protein
MEERVLDAMEQLRHDELNAALGGAKKQEEQDAATELLNSQNAEAEQKRIAAAAENENSEENKTDEKPEAEVVELSFIEKLNADPAAETTETENVPESIKAQLEAYEALKKQVEEQENSDVAKLLKSGLTLQQIADGIKKIDYSSHSIEDLIKLELEKEGITGDDLEVALDEEVSNYNSLSILARAKYDAALKANYKSEVVVDDAIKLLNEKLNENASVLDPKQKQLAIEAMAKEDLGAVDQVFDTLKKQNYEVDDNVVAAIKERYNPIMAELYVTKEGGFDVKKFIEESYTLKYHKQEKEAAVAAAEKRAYEKAKREFANPDMSSRGGGAAGTGKSVEQQLEEQELKRLKGK